MNFPVLPLVGFPELRAFFLAFMRNLLKLRRTKTAIHYFIFIYFTFSTINITERNIIITKIAQFTGKATKKVQN